MRLAELALKKRGESGRVMGDDYMKSSAFVANRGCASNSSWSNLVLFPLTLCIKNKNKYKASDVCPTCCRRTCGLLLLVVDTKIPIFPAEELPNLRQWRAARAAAAAATIRAVRRLEVAIYTRHAGLLLVGICSPFIQLDKRATESSSSNGFRCIQ